MCIYIYLSISLSLYIYIYIYMMYVRRCIDTQTRTDIDAYQDSSKGVQWNRV